MAICKDCLHINVCKDYASYDKDSIISCDNFKNKADYIEIKHGRWLKTKEPLGWQDVDCIECSTCHESWVLDEALEFEVCSVYWNFCPKCGAKMDGERKESEVQGE